MSAADSEAGWLRTVEPAQVVASLTESLHGGPPIAPLPADPDRAGSRCQHAAADQARERGGCGRGGVDVGFDRGAKGAVLRAPQSAPRSRPATPGWVDRGDWVLALPAYYIAGLMVIARACLGGTRVLPAAFRSERPARPRQRAVSTALHLVGPGTTGAGVAARRADPSR